MFYLVYFGSSLKYTAISIIYYKPNKRKWWFYAANRNDS